MIANPRYGWCDFQLGNFHGFASYLNDVPVDTLECVLDAIDGKGTGACYYEEEGGGFTLVLSELEIYIIEERGEPKLHTFSEISQYDLAKEVYQDILRHYDDWLDWNPMFRSDEEYGLRKEKINSYLARLKEVLKL